MDYHKFLAQLPDLYENWGRDSLRPKTSRFEATIKQVHGMTTTNVLLLLNLAVSCLEPEEIYCQIGCNLGANLIGAILDHPEKIACAVDDFAEAENAAEMLEQLQQNLAVFNLEEQVYFLNQDVESFFADLKQIDTADKIGIYFYNGSHDYRSQMLALLLVKPFLSERALIISGNSNSSSGQQANWDFIAAHPQCQLALDLSTPQKYHPTFWNGLQVMVWDNNSGDKENSFIFQEKRNYSLIQAFYQWEKTAESQRKNALESLLQQAEEFQKNQLFEQAEKNYRAVLEIDPTRGDVWHSLALLYWLAQRPQEALNALGNALEIESNNANYYYTLGLVLEKLDNIPQAAHAYQEAINLNPKFVDAFNNLGNIFFRAGELARSETIYRQGIVADVNQFGSYVNLGNLLLVRGKIEEAISTYQTALKLNPENPDILENLRVAEEFKQNPCQSLLYTGYHFYQAQKYQEAIEYLHNFLLREPGEAGVYIALADAYKQTRQYEKSSAVYRAGIKQYPSIPALYYGLIATLQESGKTEESIAVAAQACQLFPEEIHFKFDYHLTLPVFYKNLKQIEEYRQRFEVELNELIAQIPLETPEQQQNALTAISRYTNFFLACQGLNDLKLQKQYGNWVHKIVSLNYPQWVQPKKMPPLGENGKIRIGYLSGCLWGHTVGKLTIGWLRHHDRNKFEIYTYHLSENQDEYTQQFQLYSDKFYQIPKNPDAIAEQIIADNLHILVFLDIGQQPEITRLAALRLASVQCTTWAHPITSGLPTIDYFLSSQLMEPANANDHYSENLILLPKIGISYAKPTIPEPTKTRADFHLRNDAIVYLCCQTFFKYLPQYDCVFAAIAQRVRKAQFVFISRPNSTIAELFRQRLEKAFSYYNLEAEQYCVILPKLDAVDYWNLNLISDIFLDSFAWSGGHTTLEAIACHLPVVTCPGEFMRGRHSYGILKMLGVGDTIAKDKADYIEIAVRLALDENWRKNIIHRSVLHHDMLYGDVSCVEAMEAFYQRTVVSNLGK